VPTSRLTDEQIPAIGAAAVRAAGDVAAALSY
jgi:hypothetical protein